MSMKAFRTWQTGCSSSGYLPRSSAGASSGRYGGYLRAVESVTGHRSGWKENHGHLSSPVL